MKLVIDTQYMENYAAHDWNGEGECPEYWKYKGGETYVLRDLTTEQAMAIKSIMEQLKPLIESSDEYSREYIIDWNINDDDAQECEEWQTPWDLSFDGTNWICSKTQYRDEYTYWREEVISITESYTMLEGGGREDYNRNVVMKDAA